MAKKTELFPKREERVAYSGKAGADVERNRGKKGRQKTQRSRKSGGQKGNKARKNMQLTPKKAGIGVAVIVVLILFFAFFHKRYGSVCGRGKYGYFEYHIHFRRRN